MSGAGLRRRLRRIRGVACDVDGVLTDGGLWFGPTGAPWKRFHVHDGMGIRRLQALGIAVAFVSGDDSPVIRHRARRLDVRDVFLGCEDKAAAVREFARRRRLSLPEIAYVGDDVNDLPAMKVVGVAVAVVNAVRAARRAANLVTRTPGGWGALREVVERIEEARR